VVREIAEETGLTVGPADVIGPLATRHVLHGYTDKIVDQHDTFYALRVTCFEVSTAGHTEEEQQTMLAHRWWTRTELETSDEDIWPVLLPDLWTLLDEPSRWPVAMAHVEESSQLV
jgi:8-oxo-dGTP pyrophosphatase MutT (NUDIX family)